MYYLICECGAVHHHKADLYDVVRLTRKGTQGRVIDISELVHATGGVRTDADPGRWWYGFNITYACFGKQRLNDSEVWRLRRFGDI